MDKDVIIQNLVDWLSRGQLCAIIKKATQTTSCVKFAVIINNKPIVINWHLQQIVESIKLDQNGLVRCSGIDVDRVFYFIHNLAYAEELQDCGINWHELANNCIRL